MKTTTPQLPSLVGQEVILSGWVNSRRDHGGVIFIDLRDHDGLAQLVFNPDQKDFTQAESLRDEYVVRVTGQVRERGAGLENPNIKTGKIEVLVNDLEILNKSETPAISTHDTDDLAGEELRLKYRYLDLRRPSMQALLKKRSDYGKFLRDFMYEAGFTEVQTPILANSSPEGARDFLIPSRLQTGKCYALPQAPQQFKQLLMVGGVDKYYQIAPCFRDEDPRADRLYGEFYQLDMEMSFIDDGETIRQTMEPLFKELVTKFADKELLADDIPRLTYREAMETYGTDKPDLRYDMKLIDLTDELKNTGFTVLQKECVKAICVKGGANLSRSQIDHFTDLAKKAGAGGLAYLTYVGGEIKSPIAKFFSPEELDTITQKTRAQDTDIVFFAADTRTKVNRILGELRTKFADHFGLKDPNVIAYCWVIDFPFYEYDEKLKKLDFGHNPFSMPKGELKAFEAEDKLGIVADQYDMVMNGYEVCSGAVRNHNPDIMYKVFDVLGYDEKYVEAKFGAMLNAFKFGAPPHAGCALGLDRIFMCLVGTENIRDIVAFPKNGSGVDLMMNSPSEVDDSQLDELSIRLKS